MCLEFPLSFAGVRAGVGAGVARGLGPAPWSVLETKGSKVETMPTGPCLVKKASKTQLAYI